MKSPRATAMLVACSPNVGLVMLPRTMTGPSYSSEPAIMLPFMVRAPLAVRSNSISPSAREPNSREPVPPVRPRAAAHSCASRISPATSPASMRLRRLASSSSSPVYTRDRRARSSSVSGYLLPSLRSSYACFILLNRSVSPPRSEWCCRARRRNAACTSLRPAPSATPSMS